MNKVEPIKRLLLDIETAPHRVYTWGMWGQDIHMDQIEEPGYTLCWAAKWYGEKEVLFSSIRDGKKKMLGGIWKLLDEADAVVHYNGAKFDIPILNQEFVQIGWKPPSPYQQIDLLRVVKSRFRLASNKLDYVAQAMGLEGKVQHKGMDLWKGCMAGWEEDWEVMEVYNKRDVTILDDLYERLLPWIPNHPNMALHLDGDVAACPNCGGTDLIRKGYAFTKTMRYQRFKCKGCGTWMRARATDLPKERRASVLNAI